MVIIRRGRKLSLRAEEEGMNGGYSGRRAWQMDSGRREGGRIWGATQVPVLETNWKVQVFGGTGKRLMLRFPGKMCSGQVQVGSQRAGESPTWGQQFGNHLRRHRV